MPSKTPNYAKLLPSTQEEVTWTTCLALAFVDQHVGESVLNAALASFTPPLPMPATAPQVETEKPADIDGIPGRIDLFLEYEDSDSIHHLVAIEVKVAAITEHGDQLDRYRRWLVREAASRRIVNNSVQAHFATLLLHEPDAESELARLDSSHSSQSYSDSIQVHQGRWTRLLDACAQITPLPSTISYLLSQRIRRMITENDINSALRENPSHYPMLMEAHDFLFKAIKPENAHPRYFSGARDSGAEGAEWNHDASVYEYGVHWYQESDLCIGLRLRIPLHVPETEAAVVDLVHYSKEAGDDGAVFHSLNMKHFESLESAGKSLVDALDSLVRKS